MSTHRYRDLDVTRREYTDVFGRLCVRWDSPVFTGLKTRAQAHRAIDEFLDHEAHTAHHNLQSFWRLVARDGQIVREPLTREQWLLIMQDGVR